MIEIPIEALRPGDIILVQGTGLVSELICWFEGSRWSHVALYVGGDRQEVIEAAGMGVRARSAASMVKHHKAVKVRRPSFEHTDADIDAVVARARSLIGEPYDYPQLFSFVSYFLLAKVGIRLPALVHNDAGQMICSEVVAMAYAVLQRAFAKNIKMVTPDTLDESDDFVTVYADKE